jgi:hypothetical protein
MVDETNPCRTEDRVHEMAFAENRTSASVSDYWQRAAAWLPMLLVVIVVAFNAVMLLPEVTVPAPNINDDGAHYILVRDANVAIRQGANPVDFWVPELELGFPQFFYYQHLPHLAVVFLDRLLFERVSLLTLFNLVRYLLMVLFPAVVYFSMRKMEFTPTASAIGAAFSCLISGGADYGFEYGSYIWLGHGIYTQLWGMNVYFLSVAYLYRLLFRGEGYLGAILACSALVVCHLIYAYMLAITALLMFGLAVGGEPEKP